MNIEVIKAQLRALRLSTSAKEIELLLTRYKKHPVIDIIGDMLVPELDARKERALVSRIKNAAFPEIATLEEFDWQFNPDIRKEVIEQLATLNFLDKKGIVLFLGKPGTGKTHLALGLGLLAVRAGHKVYCTSAKRLAKEIALAKAASSLDRLFKRILSAKLWIIDDWGVIGLARDVAEEVFDLLDRRKHTSAMIVTSNRDVAEWPEVFPDGILAAASLDRMFDRADVNLFLGKSYRMKGRIDEEVVDGGKPMSHET